MPNAKEKMRVSPKDFVTLGEIVVMLKEALGVEVGTTAIHNYVRTRNFPKNIGIGCPRLWRRKDVIAWLNTFEG